MFLSQHAPSLHQHQHSSRQTCPTWALHLSAFVVLLRTLASGEPRAPHSKRVSYPHRNSHNGSRRNCGISKARIASTAPWNYTVSAMPSGLSSRVSRCCRHFKHAGNTAEWSLIWSVRNYTQVSKFDLYAIQENNQNSRMPFYTCLIKLTSGFPHQ